MTSQRSTCRFSTLKALVDSEIPWGSNILLVGPPGVGKTMFCENLLSECLRNGTTTLYITLDRAPDYTRGQVEKRGIDCTVSPLTLVDGYSWLIGGSNERYRVSNLSNLSDLSVKMISATEDIGEKSFFIFDSVSTLLIYNSENEVERFLEINMARMKHSHNIGVWVVEQGIHSEKFYNTLRHMTDGILEMRFEEEEELVRFIRMHTFKGIGHNTKWLTFTIDHNGMIAIADSERKTF